MNLARPYVRRISCLPCASCAKPFQSEYAAKYCSPECYAKANQERNYLRHIRVTGRTLDRVCKECKQPFTTGHKDRRQDYCGEACAMAVKRRINSRRTSGNAHKRRAKAFGCEYKSLDRRRVFRLAGWKCYLCGVDTPEYLSGTKDPRAPELEHVIPLSKGGPHTYANVRCACRRCNMAKGVKIMGQSA